MFQKCVLQHVRSLFIAQSHLKSNGCKNECKLTRLSFIHQSCTGDSTFSFFSVENGNMMQKLAWKVLENISCMDFIISTNQTHLRETVCCICQNKWVLCNIL
jgi:hypothetical protein